MSRRSVILFLILFLLVPTLPLLRVYGAPATVAVAPPISDVNYGDIFNVNITVSDIANFTCWELKLFFLNGVINCTAAVEGPFLKIGGGTFFNKTITNNFNATHGRLFAYSTLLGATSVNGSGTIVTITFKAIGVGNTPLHMADIKLGDEKIPPQPIPYTAIDGVVNVSSVGGHEIAVNSVIPYKTIAGRYFGCNVTVTTSNLGGSPETYNVTLYANQTEVGRNLVTVDIGETLAINFMWNASDYGGYVIWAYASPVPGETNALDNNCTDGEVIVLWPGDVQLPYRKIDMRDISYIAKRFGISTSDPLWDPNADLNNDGKIDMKDIGTVARYFALEY